MGDEDSMLTKRQRQVLQGLADGLTSRQVAQALGIAFETCRTHIKGATHRLGAHGSPHAVAEAMRSGEIE